MGTLRENLLEGRSSIGVHGLGFIGTSTAMAYAQEGVKSICYDINPDKVKTYEEGICDVINLEEWSMLRLKPFIDSGMIRPTNDLQDLKYCPVHFICVPTEKNGEPYLPYVESVLRLTEDLNKHAIIIIESTLSPEWIKELGLRDRLVCVSPRRDWFSDPNHNLKNLPRVYAAHEPTMQTEAHEAMNIVSDHLLLASSMEVACLTKALENALWFVQLVSVQQLACAYPNTDVNELFRLVGTHPRLLHFYPSIKVGGYCVPLGAKYALAGSPSPEYLTLFKESLRFNEDLVRTLFEDLGKLFEKSSVAIMGITYKSDLKIHTLSPALDVAKCFPNAKAHDPYYSDSEIKDILNLEAFDYPDDLGDFEGIIILTDHKEYHRTPLSVLREKLEPGCYIFDNLGVWRRHAPYFKRYYRFGSGVVPIP